MPPAVTAKDANAARRLVNEKIPSGFLGFDSASKRALIDQVAQRLAAGQTEANARAEIAAYVGTIQQQQTQQQDQERAAVLSTPLGSPPPSAAPGGAPAGTPAAGGKKQMSLADGFRSHVDALLKSPINVADYRKPDGSFDSAAYTAAQGDYASQLTEAMDSMRQAQQLQIGIIEVPDGQGGNVILDVNDPALERDPQLAAQMATYFANQDSTLANKWAMTLHELELDDYAGAVAQTNMANSNASKAFQDALELVQNRVSIGQANQDTAMKEITRQLQGMAESRARASDAETQLSAAAGWATTPGKTSFSGNDLGAGIAGLARFGGVAPDAPLLNFTGTRTTDPLGMMAQGDAALGVTGQLASIPGLGVTATDLPGAPGYAGMPAGRPKSPTLTPPQFADRTPQLRLTGYNAPEEGGY